MLKCAGYTQKEAGITLFGTDSQSFNGISAVEAFYRQLSLINRLFSRCLMVNDFTLALLLPSVRTALPPEGRAFLDQHKFRSTDELLQAMIDWWKIAGGT